MSRSGAWQDADIAVGSRYILVREAPKTAGFSSFAARSRSDGSNVEVRTVPDWVIGQRGIKSSDLAARRVQHPNILPLVEAASSDGVFYWIAPAIDGRTLRSRLTRGGRMDMYDVLTVLRDISAGLTHAHLHGVVHGGLTPDSVIVSGGSALVADLGIPEVFAGLRREGSRTLVDGGEVIEPLRYASPEQAAGGDADARSDVYAWGVIAYEMLSGRHPFAGRMTPRQMMAAHTDEQPPQLAGGPGTAPTTVTRLVMRCLSKDPSKRPESAREVFAILTKELLVPPPAPKAGTGQKVAIALMLGAVLVIAMILLFGAGS